MIFTETPLQGAFRIDLECVEDERGFFARSFCQNEFLAHGLNPHIAQCNVSYNKKRGTLRGMHYQASPHEEAKVVQCTRGSIYDVIIDLRPSSPTFGRWTSVTLTAKNRSQLYIPESFAHGFQTLEDDSEVLYLMSTFYVPDSARGIRWNDPRFSIRWPVGEMIISAKDRAYPDFVLR